MGVQINKVEHTHNCITNFNYKATRNQGTFYNDLASENGVLNYKLHQI